MGAACLCPRRDVIGCFQRFFFCRRLERQQAQQHHAQTGVFIGCQPQLGAAMHANAVKQLGFVWGQIGCQPRNFRSVGIGFIHRHAGYGLLHSHALQDARHIFERTDGRKPLFLQRLHASHDLRGIATSQRINQAQHMAAANAPEHLPHRRLLHALTAAKGDGLVGQRQGVTHGAARRARQQVQRARFGHDLFGAQHLLQMGGDGFWRHGPQVELQAAREHGHRHLLWIGGGQHELEVFRRLLQRFQHGIEGRIGQHVHFIDHEDLEAPLYRLVDRLFQQGLHFVHAAVAGGVQFGVVHEAAGIDRRARRTLPAGRGRDAPLPVNARAVERLGQNARNRGLAHAACAGEQVGMMQPLLRQRISQRLHHVLLPHHFSKMTGTVFAGQHQIRHGQHSRAC